jgi:hypothetical protein
VGGGETMMALQLDEAGLVLAVARSPEEALEVIKAMAEECRAGKGDREREARRPWFQSWHPSQRNLPAVCAGEEGKGFYFA